MSVKNLRACGCDDFEVDRLECEVVGHLCRTGGETDDEIHLSAQLNAIARVRSGWADLYASVSTNLDIHEGIERRRNSVARNPERFEVTGEVVEATGMRACVLVDEREGLAAAGRVQKVVIADRVADDGEHDSATVGIQRMTDRETYRVVVIDASSRREPLFAVVAAERDQVGDLLAAGIDDPEHLPS